MAEFAPQAATWLGAYALESSGKYDEVKPLYERALAIAEKNRGPEHSVTGQLVSKMGRFYFSRGEYATAERFGVRALAIAEKNLGPDDPHLVTSLNNLVSLYNSMGQSATAEPLAIRA